MSITFKRNYKLLILLALVAAALLLVLRDQRIVAYTTGGSTLQVAVPGVNHSSDVALFDDTVVHTIQVLISDADYKQMITTYKETGEKDYFHADIIIDGVQVSNVGIRLKGNSSLFTALDGGRGFPGGGQQPGGNLPFDPETMPNLGDMPQFDPENMPNLGGRQQRPGAGQMPGAPPGNVASDQGDGDAKLPFLIKFDEFVAGQTYQGCSRLAIRTYGGPFDASMLQEPVTNAVFRLAGLPAPQTAYVGLQINDQAEQLYSISEVIDGTYLAQHFSNPDGVLYKAEIGSSLSYAGEDPSAYARSFSQETRVNDADIAPLIAFMCFLTESDDAAFERDLPTWLDVDALATYLAVNNLLVNADSIAGMNNNYYLYYDDVAEHFTLLMWDGNESLGKIAGNSRAATYDLYYKSQQGFGRGMGGPMGKSNILVTRFLANPTFTALYESKLRQVYQQVFVSGAITQQVEQYAALVRQANEQRSLVEAGAYEQSVASVLDFITQRSAYLAVTPLLGGQTGDAGLTSKGD